MPAELGVSRLQPVFTRHTAVARVNRVRLAANAREAAEQCERLSLPEVSEARDIFAALADWPSERRLLLCAEAGPAEPIAETLAKTLKNKSNSAPTNPGYSTAPWAVMTGPEGGFAESELDALRNLPFVIPVALGPRLLRADTAALVALACWQALLGDGRDLLVRG